jgi:lysophospholipase L1-like esterase
VFILDDLAVLLLLLVAVELVARRHFRRRYGIPFKSRRIGEYPYRAFIEKVGPPLHFRFRRGFRSPLVNINRFGCRGPEPAPDGQKKRLLLIGESNFFGVKLPSEKALWDARLRALLRLRGNDEWEIINAGTPIYNSFQHLAYWKREIARVKPDIVVVGFGFNDLSQAWMLGGKWEPGRSVWPEEFIYALERRSPWWEHLLAASCTWILWHRKLSKRHDFPRFDDDFQWHRCLAVIEENYRAIRDLAASQGARTAAVLSGFMFDLEPTPEVCRRLDGIQANWRDFHERGKYDLALTEEMRGMSRRLGLPLIDIDAILRRHPRRFELYLDIAHFNVDGMRVVARVIYDAIDALGWWREDG